MKFALVNELRQEAQPNFSGVCQVCGRLMVAKCGERRIWHWSHQKKSACDPWWENETEWHRTWKSQFPEEWQEIIHRAESGEKHIADVKTAQDWGLEFQHSYIQPEERQSRDSFYKRVVWVVDGTRRKRDKKQFFEALEQGRRIGTSSLVRIYFPDECGLLREWSSSPSPIFFDFGEDVLWWLVSRRPNEPAYITRVLRTEFIGVHKRGAVETSANFDFFVNGFHEAVARDEAYLAESARLASIRPLPGFQQYSTRRSRTGRRF